VTNKLAHNLSMPLPSTKDGKSAHTKQLAGSEKHPIFSKAQKVFVLLNNESILPESILHSAYCSTDEKL